mgnify:CR=1 FL=1
MPVSLYPRTCERTTNLVLRFVAGPEVAPQLDFSAPPCAMTQRSDNAHTLMTEFLDRTGVNSDDIGDVTLTLEDGRYVARDEETDVASQGKTRPEALANLAEALKLHERPVPDGVDVDGPSSAPWL